MTPKQNILLGVGILLAALIIGGTLFAVNLRSKSVQTAEPTPTPLVTEAPTPTASEPTETPVSTPQTRVPTATPRKTPTPTPRPTSAATATPRPTATVTPAPGVVNIENTVSPTSATTCSQKFVFSAKMYTNGAATVKYRWVKSDNSTGAEQSITYTSAGMQTVTMEWTPDTLTAGNTMNGWARIELISPGTGMSNKAEFTLSCPGSSPTPSPSPSPTP